MKKFAFLALLFLLYYIAVMYGSPALMVIFLAQLILMLIMLILSFYLRNHLSVSFSDQLIFAEMGKNYTLKMNTENAARLPVSRFMVPLIIRCEETGEKYRRTVPGSCACGKDTVTFEDKMKHCGIYQVDMKWLEIYDYLTLFSRKKAMKSRVETAVFPPKINMKIRFVSAGQKMADQYQTESFLPGSGYDEIRQIREYRAGDPPRHIHWNQTARTGRLWVKEYEEEPEGKVCLSLDMSGMSKRSPDEKDHFYILLYAVLRGLLKGGRHVLVCWDGEGQTGIYQKEVRDERECSDFLLMLYRKQGGTARHNGRNRMTERYDVMCLTDNLFLYMGNRLIYQFSHENLIQELTGNTFE